MKKLMIISFLIATFSANCFSQKKLNIYAAANYGLYKVKPSDVYTSAIFSIVSGGIGKLTSLTICHYYHVLGF